MIPHGNRSGSAPGQSHQNISEYYGKCLRRSHDRRKGFAALHLVSAWATANRVVLGQVATEAKSNEITAIPRLLQWLNLNGCIVTIDAMGCQTAIAEQFVEQGGDYVLSQKAEASENANISKGTIQQ